MQSFLEPHGLQCWAWRCHLSWLLWLFSWVHFSTWILQLWRWRRILEQRNLQQQRTLPDRRTLRQRPRCFHPPPILVGREPLVEARLSSGHMPTSRCLSCHPALGYMPTSRCLSCRPALGYMPTSRCLSCRPALGYMPTSRCLSCRPALGYMPTSRCLSCRPVLGHMPTSRCLSCRPALGHMPSSKCLIWHAVLARLPISRCRQCSSSVVFALSLFFFCKNAIFFQAHLSHGPAFTAIISAFLSFRRLEIIKVACTDDLILLTTWWVPMPAGKGGGAGQSKLCASCECQEIAPERSYRHLYAISVLQVSRWCYCLELKSCCALDCERCESECLPLKGWDVVHS